MSTRRRVVALGRGAVAVLVLVLAPACGLYGERGFTGHNPLRPARFIEESDERCQAANDDLDEEVGAVLEGRQTSEDEVEDAARHLRDVGDDLAEELDEVYGPDDLENHRDDLVQVLEDVDDLLADVKDDPGGAPALLDQVRQRFSAVERELRDAGFKVCGTPRPAG